MERRWNRFLPTAELSRLDGAAGKPVIVSADTFSVIKSAVDAWGPTDGCFDPTEANHCYAVIIDDNAALSEIGCLEELAA